MQEAWRQIPGYSRYSVSDQGRVRRNVMVYRSPAGMCRSQLKQGYPQVAVTSDDGKSRTIMVHRLLMLAFVGPCPEGFHVCHADGDRANCTLPNLRYDTPTANVHDAIRHGTQVKGEAVTQHILAEGEVREILALLDSGATYIEIAARYPITNHCVYRIAAGKTWRHITGGQDRRNGYKFNSRGALAAKAKRDELKAAGLVEVVKLDDGADMVCNGCRVWQAI